MPKPKEKRVQKKELSKPRDAKGPKSENPTLDNIKNSILKIKEKAFNGEASKQTQDEKVSKTLDTEMRGYVSISSINLCNAKEKKEEEARIMKDFEHIPKDIPTFSLHQENNTAEVVESDSSNLTSKEPESHHPSGSKYLQKPGTSQASTTFDKSRYQREKTDFQNDFSKDSNFDLLGQEKPVKSLNVSKTIDVPSRTSAIKRETDFGPKRTVRFKEGDHFRQKSGFDTYSKYKRFWLVFI